ncbi:hypothetical protein QL093DRAFT_2106665 [Fusarium oxysporum]|nr:hypothetical protein QL093DRAFT_2106665 [Fusarium oxysporum]
MVETLYAMMEVHFKAKMTQLNLQKKMFSRSISLHGGEVKDELWNLLGKEKVLEEWGVQGLFLMTSNGEIFNAMEDERLLKGFQNAYFGGISR